MELKVFKRAIELGYDDSHMVFFNMMYLLIFKEGKKTNFYFYAKDVKKILNIINDPELNKTRDALRPFFNVAAINPWTLRISWNCDKRNEHGKGIMHVVPYDITEVRALNIYFYLLGRMLDPTILTDKPVIYDGTERHYENIQPYTYRLFEHETFTGK